MLYGMNEGGAGVGVGEVGADPYSDAISASILDARNILGLWNQAFPTAQPLYPGTGINPATGLPYTYVPPASTGMFGMDNTTLLMVGALAVGGLFMFMKR